MNAFKNIQLLWPPGIDLIEKLQTHVLRQSDKSIYTWNKLVSWSSKVAQKKIHEVKLGKSSGNAGTNGMSPGKVFNCKNK